MEALSQIRITDLAKRCPVPTLVLVGRDKGEPLRSPSHENFGSFSALSGEDRQRFSSALRRGTLSELDTGHDLHEAVFDDLVAQIGKWLPETLPIPQDGGLG